MGENMDEVDYYLWRIEDEAEAELDLDKDEIAFREHLDENAKEEREEELRKIVFDNMRESDLPGIYFDTNNRQLFVFAFPVMCLKCDFYIERLRWNEVKEVSTPEFHCRWHKKPLQEIGRCYVYDFGGTQ